MSPESLAMQGLRSRIKSFLDQANITYRINADNNYLIKQGSTVVMIQPLQWQNNRTLVKVFAPVALNITRATPDLAFFLAEENRNLWFGKFSLDIPARAVWFEHVLLGDFLDADELLIVVRTIARDADAYDERIARESGGQRAIDY